MKTAVILLLAALTGCTSLFNRNTEPVLARVKDDYLFASELKGIIPAGTPVKDSISLARQYIDYWIRQRLIIHAAEKNLPAEKQDFTRQMEEYRSSLVIYAYENELVRQKLDTVVPDEEIEQYYDANRANFLLKENIVRVQYIKVPPSSPNIPQMKKLLRSDESRDRTRLSELCEKSAADYFLDDSNWLRFSDLVMQVPLKTYNQEEFLRDHREVEYRDSLFVYLVRFLDFRIREDVSPLSFEKERVRNIILNKRKVDLINRMHGELYDQAQKKGDFEIY